MEWVETTGKTVEAALDAALDQLGVDEQDVDYQVLSEPKTGLFGRLKGEARVRARVKPVSREKPDHGRQRGGGRRSERGSRSKSKKAPAGAGRGGQKSSKGAASTAPGGKPDAKPGASKRRRRRGSGTSKTGPDRAEQNTEGNKTVEEHLTVEEQSEMAVDFATGLVEAFGARAEVTSTLEDEDNILVEITGDDLGLLVGPKGATLAAVEELVRTVVQRSTAGGSARVHVDVGGYRAKRRAALSAFATEVADRVIDSGEDKALEPMSAADRKVVHDALSDVEGVETSSEGEEPRRRVVVHLA